MRRVGGYNSQTMGVDVGQFWRIWVWGQVAAPETHTWFENNVPYRLDARRHILNVELDMRAIRQVRVLGDTAVALVHALNQPCAYLLLVTFLDTLAEGPQEEIWEGFGIFCSHGHHRSLVMAQLVRHLFAPLAQIFQYEADEVDPTRREFEF